MELENLTLKQIKEIQNMGSCGNHPYKVGEKYIFRTVTMIFTGKLEAVYDKELVISNAAWVAETARWHDTCMTGKLNEVEPFNTSHQVIIGRGSIIDVSPWDFDLPQDQK